MQLLSSCTFHLGQKYTLLHWEDFCFEELSRREEVKSNGQLHFPLLKVVRNTMYKLNPLSKIETLETLCQTSEG